MTRVANWIGIVVLLSLAVGMAPAEEPKPDKPATEEKAKLPPPGEKAKQPEPDAGDTAWMLVSTGLVMLMVPGLALFYGGMVRRKNILGTMMHSMVALASSAFNGCCSATALAFGATHGGFIGWDTRLSRAARCHARRQLFPGTQSRSIVHCMYQGMFAIITPALISGALAERVRFGPYCLFILLWAVLVYDPLAHWVWAVKLPRSSDPTPSRLAGWARWAPLDFAGGTVVHIAAGFSAPGGDPGAAQTPRLSRARHAPQQHGADADRGRAALVRLVRLQRRQRPGQRAAQAGSALAATQLPQPRRRLAGWSRNGCTAASRPPSASPPAWSPAWSPSRRRPALSTPLRRLAIGLIAGVVCYVAVCLKPLFKYDDSLDAFGVHGVGGFLGAILTGVFASAALYADQCQRTCRLPLPRWAFSTTSRHRHRSAFSSWPRRSRSSTLSW